MVRQSRFVIMRMYNNFHLTFSKNQNIIKTKRVANERKSGFAARFFNNTINRRAAYLRKSSLSISTRFFCGTNRRIGSK